MANASAGGSGGKAAGILAGRAFVSLSADDAGLRHGLEAARKMVEKFGHGVTMAGAGLVAVGAGMIAPIALAFQQALEHLDEFQKLSERTGASTESLSALGYAAQQSYASVEDLADGAKHLQRTISEAAAGSGQATEALDALGLHADDLKGKSLEEQFYLIADGLQSIPDPADKTAAAMAVLGRGGGALIPMLNKGSAALRQLAKEAEDVGAVVKGEDAKKAQLIVNALDTAWTALRNTFLSVGEALLPQADTIKELTTAFVKILKTVREFIEENRSLVLGIVTVGAAVIGAGAAFIAIGTGLSFAVTAAGAFVAAIGVAGSVLAALVSPIGLIVATVAVVAVALASLVAEFGDLDMIGNTLSSVWGGLLDTFLTTWKGIKAALAEGDLKKAFEILVAGLDVVWKGAMAGLTIAWNDFKEVVVDGWHGILTEIQVVLASVVRAVGDSFRNITSMIPDRIRRNLPGETRALLDVFDLGAGIASEQQIRAAAAAAKADRIAARAGDVTDALKALEDARAHLRDVAAVVEAPIEHGPMPRELEFRRQRAIAGVTGGFTASNLIAQAFGAGKSTADKIAANTGATADNTKKIADQGGGVAWD